MPAASSSKTPATLVPCCLAIGILISLLYFLRFNGCVNEACNGLVLPYNIPDHLTYVAVIRNLPNVAWWLPLAGNYGVSLLYGYAVIPLYEVFAASDNLLPLTLTFNLALYVGSVVTFSRLLARLGGPNKFILIFAFYPPFLLFSALINKDIFLIFLILRVCVAMLDRRYVQYVVLVFCLMLVRVQYVALLPFALVLAGKGFKYKFICFYILTSLLAAVVARSTGLFELDDSGGGLSELIFNLNQRYLVGSLIFNPIRVIQYPFALAKSLTLIYDQGQLNLMRLLEGASFFWFLFMLPGLIGFLFRPGRLIADRNFLVLRAIIVAFFLILLLTSITEPRYLMAIFPIMLLAVAKGSAEGISKRQESLRLGRAKSKLLHKGL